MKRDKQKLTKKQIADLDFEISFYESILKENPDYLDVLIPLADDYTKRGLYEKGLQADIKIIAQMPDDDTAVYNLACSYSLLYMTDKALKALEKAFSLGYQDLQWINEDPDLENIRTDKGYSTIIEKYFSKEAKKT